MVIALMGQQLHTSTFEVLRLDIDGCVASVDVQRRHQYKDGSTLVYVQCCRLEVHGGLVHRFEASLLDAPQRGLFKRGTVSAVPANDGHRLPRNIIRVHSGGHQVWVKQEDVRYLQAAGKHTLVATCDVNGVVRAGLGATAALFNRQDFWQIHRGNVINVNLIRASYRDELGRLMLTLVDGSEKFIVSRSYEHLFVRGTA